MNDPKVEARLDKTDGHGYGNKAFFDIIATRMQAKMTTVQGWVSFRGITLALIFEL